jgi:hypothetical protein
MKGLITLAACAAAFALPGVAAASDGHTSMSRPAADHAAKKSLRADRAAKESLRADRAAKKSLRVHHTRVW